MDHFIEIVIFFVKFIVIALASWQAGKFFKRFGLPVITGYLFTGILVGPFFLDLVPERMGHELFFLEELSLAFIAFAAGSELYLPELRGRLRSIGWVTFGLVVVTFVFVTTAVFLLSNHIPFMREMSVNAKLAVALMAGAIMTARSPSSAIAIVNELRAKGPFTQTVLGVTVIMDVVVITLFAITASVADVLLTNQSFRVQFFLLVLSELVLAVLAAGVLYLIVNFILSLKFGSNIKAILIVFIGYGTFLSLDFLRDYSHEHMPIEVLIEPLLVCLIASFIVNNFSKHRTEFSKILHDTGPLIYVLFFTLVGSLLQIPVFLQTWPIALALFLTRVVAIAIGSFAGATIAGEPVRRSQMFWMGFVTQAGVALGLAEETAVEFNELGSAFATMIISVVVINEIVGPIFFKRAVKVAGEARVRGEQRGFDGIRDVVIFGLKPQSVQLARQLLVHDWQVKIVGTSSDDLELLSLPEVETILLEETVTLADLENLDMAQADALVTFWPNDESYRICELAYENFGTETMVFLMNDRTDYERFNDLGVLVVEPQTAVVTLLEQFVRAPAGTSMLLGMDDEQQIVDVEMLNPAYDGVSLKNINLPLGVLILSTHRDGHALVTRGYTKLKHGDLLTMVGPEEELEEVMLRFEPS